MTHKQIRSEVRKIIVTEINSDRFLRSVLDEIDYNPAEGDDETIRGEIEEIVTDLRARFNMVNEQR